MTTVTFEDLKNIREYFKGHSMEIRVVKSSYADNAILVCSGVHTFKAKIAHLTLMGYALNKTGEVLIQDPDCDAVMMYKL